MTVRVIEPIVEQHAEDAAFLWLLRDAATDAPNCRLRELARLDERVEAHLDGLRVAGEPGWRMALEALRQHREPGESFAAAVLALESRAAERIGAVLEQAGAEPANLRAVVSAIGWIEPARLRGTAAALLDDPRPQRRMLGVAACSVHRIDPGPRLTELLAGEPVVRGRALRLAGELGRVDLLPTVARGFADGDAACRLWAGWAGALLGDRRDALAVLRGEVEAHGAQEGRALRVVLRAMDPAQARSWLRDLRDDPRKERLVVEGAGILGDPGLVPWLIRCMEEPRVARLAGESFTMITGADLEGEGLATPPPPADEAAEPAGAAQRDDDLPWPDPVAVRAWWDKRSRQMPPQRKHLLGGPTHAAGLRAFLAEGLQRHRRAAALELALAHPEAPLFNCRARAALQIARCREAAA